MPTCPAKAVGALERGERRRPYPNTVRALCRALGLDDTEARTLADAVRPTGEESTPAITPPARVPVPPTSMLGRGSELAQVAELVDLGTTRLVTITGPGGVGKTRLALEVAALVSEGGREVIVVELAAVGRVDLVLPAIARAVGLHTGPDDIVGSIVGLLGDRSPVLVLDNFEHVLGAAAEVAELVRRCPRLVVLATSRVPLRIRAEHEVPLGPLSVPVSRSDVAEVIASPSAQVFADRARGVVPDFAVDASNAAAVAAICRRLDGLPLALELAAAHVRYLSPSQLLEHLDHAVDAGGPRDLPQRQRTMKATLDWSYELLTTDEQEVLGALSVFAGGFDLPAAAEIASMQERDVLSAIEGLVAQSLVVGPQAARSDGSARLRLLEPVREYAAASMSAEDAVLAEERHATYFSRLGRDGRSGLRTADLPDWLDRLESEHANLRRALTTLLDRGDLSAAAGLGGDTWLYWALRGHAGEGLLWWQRVLDHDRAGQLDEPGRAAAHLAVAGLCFATGDIERARSHGAAAAAGAHGDGEVLTEALLLCAMGAAFAGDLPMAGSHLADLSELDVHEDDAWTRALLLISQAQVSLLAGNLEQCRVELDLAEGLARRGAGPFVLGTVLNLQSTLALVVDDEDVALRSASEAAELAADVGTSWTLVYTLSTLATLAVRRGRPDLAAVYFSAGAAAAEATLVEMAFRPDRESADVHLAEVQRQLSADEFDRCWAMGRSLQLGDLVDLVQEINPRAEPS